MSLKYWLLWRKLRRKLSEALESERARIGSKQASIVQDFIDHNEFGLAHAQISDALSELRLEPLPRTQVILDEAGTLMQSAS